MGAFTKLTYHAVFGTKYRQPLITEDVRDRLYKYLGGIIRKKDGHTIEVGGVADHVHILAQFPATVAFADMMKHIKGSSSGWLNDERLLRQHFEWQKGYGAFTVSYSHVPVLQRYIRNQESHHHTQTFEEEFMALLQRHDIPFERRYLFEAEYHG